MRRCHSETMQEYRRQHNAEMWARGGAPVKVPSYRCETSRKAVREQGVGE